MAAIVGLTKLQPVTLNGDGSADTVELNPVFTTHHIVIRGETGDVSVQFKPFGFDVYEENDDGVIQQNRSAIFDAGPCSSVKITPTESVEFTAAVYSW